MVYVFSGAVTDDAMTLVNQGMFDGIYAITPEGMSLENALRRETAMNNMMECVAKNTVALG